MSIPLGFQAKAYYLSTGTRATWGTAAAGIVSGVAPASLAEITNAQDIEIPLTASEADVTARVNGGYKATQAGLIDLAVDIPMLYVATDAFFLACMAALIARTTVAIAFLDGAKTVVGTLGFWADWSVLAIKKGEKLGEAQMYTITVKPGYSAVAPEVVKVTAS